MYKRQAVKRGVFQAGGFPVEFPVISLGESLMKPTTMLYRNLMAMDVEESIRAYPLDGVVAHNYVHVLEVCDRVVLLQHGEITLDKLTSETSVQELTALVVAEYRALKQEREA